MIVPTSPGATSFAPTEQPSETNLLMALAEMHKQGRFDQPEAKPTNVIAMPKRRRD